MSETVLVALISAGGALIVGLTSVSLNVFWMARSFDQLRTSMGDMRTSMGDIRTSIGDLRGETRTNIVDLRTSISDMRSDFNKRFDRIDVRLDRVEEDLKQFYRVISEHSTDIARLKDKTDTN